MLKLYIKHGMVVDKVHEILSFKQSNWLEKIYVSIHKKEIGPKVILKKMSYLITHFMEKRWGMIEIE